MRIPFQKAIFAILLLGLIVCVCVVWPRKPSNGEPSELTDEQVWFPGGGVISEPYVKVEAGHKRMVERIQEKQAVVESLIRGEVTLSDAAQRFRAIHEGDATPLMTLRNRYPRAGIDELWHRHVIQYLHGYTRTDPVRIPQLVNSLEAEVARKFAGQPRPADANSFAPQTETSPGLRPIEIGAGGSSDRHRRRR